MSGWTTADLLDDHPNSAVVDPLFADFGGRSSFAGPAFTVRVFEDNSLVRASLETEGDGYVLVVDGGGSTRRALVGDRLAQLAIDNNWAGIIIWGAVRDTATLKTMDIGIKAVAACPRRSDKRNEGSTDLPVTFGSVTIEPGDWVYADADGVIVANHSLLGPAGD